MFIRLLYHTPKENKDSRIKGRKAKQSHIGKNLTYLAHKIKSSSTSTATISKKKTLSQKNNFWKKLFAYLYQKKNMYVKNF